MHSLFRFFQKWEVKPMRKLCYSLIFQRYYPSQSVKEVFESKKDGFASFFMELCQMICFTCSFPMHCTFPEKGNACLNQQILSLLWEKRQCLSRKGRSLSWKRNYISLKRQCLLEKRYSLAWKGIRSQWKGNAYQGGKRSSFSWKRHYMSEDVRGKAMPSGEERIHCQKKLLLLWR